MNTRPLVIAVAAAVVLGAAGYGAYTVGMQRGMEMSGGAAPSGHTAAATSAAPAAAEGGEAATRRHLQLGLKAGDVDPANGQRILYYQDPMVPGKRFDAPGKSPFMDMMLSPVYAGGDADAGRVTVSPRIQQNLGVRTAAVAEGTLAPQMSAVGAIAFNERDQAIVPARATGFVEKLSVRATLDRVAKGQPLAELYVPEWVAAQEEFLSVRRMQGTELAPLVDGARQRMRQAGMSEEHIRLVESTGRTHPRLTLAAPIGGVVVELMAREGKTVMAGETLFRINGLSTVWANAEVPESQAALVRPGARVTAKSPAAPGEVFEGKVQAILPEVNAATRTIKARLELANPRYRLVPGMFVTMQFAERTSRTLLVPTEALIHTGRRTVVLLAEEDGRFRPVEVEAGIESGGQTEIRRGLHAGQRVVVSSQFLIDSEASLRGVEARLNAEPVTPAASAAGHDHAAHGAPPAPGVAHDPDAHAAQTPPPAPRSPAAGQGPRHAGEGVVESLEGDAVMLSHGPIPSLKWDAMTMEFKLPPGGAPRGLKAGDRVRFEFTLGPDGAQLTTLASAGGAGSRP
ncbi:MAG TPA: efflux RND transporter periplasmic adaptor subunit [Albitalea sp.]